jgi:putative PIN family toxin of toxin-antitoxin system
MRVVIDTNVLVAALRSRRGTAFRVLEELQKERFEFAVSVPLFLEYEDVLKRPGLVPLPLTAIERFLRYIAANGQTQSIFFLWRPFLNDAKDDMVLEVAVAARCAAIVTFNGKDFVGVERFGLEVWTPYEFLMRLDELEQLKRTEQKKENPKAKIQQRQQTKAQPNRKKKGS